MPCIPSVARDITNIIVERAVHEEYERPQQATTSPSIATAAIAVATNILWVWPGKSPSLRKVSNSTKGYGK